MQIDQTQSPKPKFYDFSGIVDEKLSLHAFQNYAGQMAGYPFIKVVVERATGSMHFINHHRYDFHVDYVAEQILKTTKDNLRENIDSFNQKTYLQEDREYYLGIVSLQENEKSEKFFALETVEIDNMNTQMVLEFFGTVKDHLDSSIPTLFKPANHHQESIVKTIDQLELPRVYNHELFASKKFVPLNAGTAKGRLRYITEENFESLKPTIEWYDIICMKRVPEDIPRVAGIINAEHTTPLSHTNVLAHGWQIPNAIEINVIESIFNQQLDGKWVQYTVDVNANHVLLKEIEPIESTEIEKPSWHIHQITLEEPEVENTPIKPLDQLRMTDRFRYGTKAANLGELHHILKHGSPRLTGFYRVPRPPRQDLLNYMMKFLGTSDPNTLQEKATQYLNENIKIPRGISLPFAIQQEFLASSPKIQQAIGKLKMALELDVKEIDSLCILIQRLIKQTKINDKLRDQIDAHITNSLAGVSSFVVRSSSNAEDLADFSAAGIYESTNHITSADKLFASIKDVWASLVSPRSVRLRQQVGISLDDCYMGVIIQEEISSNMGGVLVTTNPMNKDDFRNVFINASTSSAVEVVDGTTLAHQYLFNTLEGGGRTLSLGKSATDLTNQQFAVLQKLAYAGRLLQSHFSQNYVFNDPADIEWAADGDNLYVLQLRPFSI